jgi:hypothetical protein
MRRRHAAEAGAVVEPVAPRYQTSPYDLLVEELLDTSGGWGLLSGTTVDR